jgi:CHAT domain-containing protein
MSFPRFFAFVASFAAVLSLSTWLLWAQSPFSTEKELNLADLDAQIYANMSSHNWQAFEEKLAQRQAALAKLGSDSAAQDTLQVQLLQQYLWTAESKMRFRDHSQFYKNSHKSIAIANQLAADKKNIDDNRLMLIAESEALYAMLYTGSNAFDKDFKPLIALDSSLLYLERARRTAAQLKDKKSLAASDLKAFIYFVACRIHLAEQQFALAVTAGTNATTELEKNPNPVSKISAINYFRNDFYPYSAWALFLAKSPIEEFIKPIHIGLLQISYSDSTYRAEQIAKVRSGEITPASFDVPFDSISNKMAADLLMAAKMHGLAEWLEQQNEATRKIYYPVAFRAAQLRTQVLEYCNQQLHRLFDKKLVLNDMYRCYETAIALANQMHQRTNQPEYLQTAVHWMEKMRSVFLMSNLHEANRQAFAGIPDSLIQQFEALQQEIVILEQTVIATPNAKNSQARENLAKSRQNLDALLDVFKRDYPKYYALQNRAELPTFAQIREQLGDSTTLLQFYDGYYNTYIFSINRDTMSLRAYPHAPYNTLLGSLIEQCTKPNFEDSMPKMIARFGNDAHQFYNQYIRENVSAATHRLIVIADGNLHYLPLEVLCYDSLTAAASNFSQLPYLIRKYSISYQYGLGLWYDQQKNPRAGINSQTLAMAADYKVNTQQIIREDSAKTNIMRSFRADDVRRLRPLLAPLKGVTVEIETLSEQYRGTFYSGEDANEAEFKRLAPYYGILHLAMHSVVNESNPSRSSLAFTETLDTLEDNFLMAYEIKQMQLNSSLVVLSACETGYGKYEHGEGVLSVGMSFIYAGSRSLVTTLWQLNDQTAPPIILNFYSLLQTKADKDEALRRSKLAFLDQNNSIASHPAYWACFVQVGDYSPLLMSERTFIWWYLLPVVFVIGIGWWARKALRQSRKF